MEVKREIQTITENFSGISGGVRRFSVYIAKDTLGQVCPLCPLNTRKYCFFQQLNQFSENIEAQRRDIRYGYINLYSVSKMLFWGSFFPWFFGHAVFTAPRHLMCSFTFCQSQVLPTLLSLSSWELPKRWAVRASWQAWAQRIKASTLCLGRKVQVITQEMGGSHGVNQSGEAFEFVS